MERRPDDIFRVHDLSVLKSPMPTHILNASSNMTPSPAGNGTLAKKGGTLSTPSFSTPVLPVRPTPKPSTFALGLSSLARTANAHSPSTPRPFPPPTTGQTANLPATKAQPTSQEPPISSSALPATSPAKNALGLEGAVLSNHRQGETNGDGTLSAAATTTTFSSSSSSSSTLPTVSSVLEGASGSRLPDPSCSRALAASSHPSEALGGEDPSVVSTINTSPKTRRDAQEERIPSAGSKTGPSEQPPAQPAPKSRESKTPASAKAVSTGSEICLSHWSLVVVPNNPNVTKLEKSVTEDWVVLVGKRNDMSEMWHSSLITGRLSNREVTTGSGRIYRLEGPADELALIEAGFSFDTVEAFKLGFPESWQLVLIQEFGSLKKTNESAPPPLKAPSSKLAGLSLADKEATKPTPSAAETPVPADPPKRKRGRPPKNRPLLPPPPPDPPVPDTLPSEEKENASLGVPPNQSGDKADERHVPASADKALSNHHLPDGPSHTMRSTPKEATKSRTPRTLSKICRTKDEVAKAKTSPAKRRRSEPHSWWKSRIETPPIAADFPVLGQTRSGRRVIAPLPYWENKYLRSSVVTAMPSPTLRGRKQLEKRHCG